ncbi:MAG: hypothetical protein QG597_1516, partial [Actinomycetota bacterium]|nr:hypothetical protein [Actinomycetota bacterium]
SDLRAQVVLPPGSGKTLVGLAAAARLGSPTLILSPNTAIQGQWVRAWRQFFNADDDPDSPTMGTSRALTADLTSLTYQSVATFDSDAEVDEDGVQVAGHLGRLSEAARAVFDRLAELGPATLILDECHHLLAVWGELLSEVLASLPQVRVIGLTATPARALTRSEADLAARLLGPPVFEASTPALIKQGYLAPYAELAWLCRPTAQERDWLAEDAERFRELRNDITAPGFASTDFFTWLDFYVQRLSAGEWRQFEASRPRLASAIMRSHFEGLVDAPAGARLLEAYRQPPQPDDWAQLIGEYADEVLRDSPTPGDAKALAQLKAALPALGFTLTAKGVVHGRSPVDRVVARSDAKTRAAVEIVAAESANLANRMRALVITDHERATATVPANLTGVIEPEAGSAIAVARRLAGDSRLASRGVVLVTGRTVAASARGAAILRAARPDLPWRTDGTLTFFGEGLVDGDSAAAARRPGWTGPTGWTPRQWVPLVTDLLDNGAVSVLVGTRGLLGEGWDAQSVTTVVDLTSATTATSVVQVRGRSLRLDPTWSDKVAHTWSVVCVADDHLHGWADYDRLVRKHEGYFGLNDEQQVVAGVSHIDAELSPYHPPASDRFDTFNAAMLARAEQRSETLAAWRVGEPFRDLVTPSVQVVPAAGVAGGVSAVSPRRPGQAASAEPVGRVAALPAVGGLSRNVARLAAPMAGAVALLAGVAVLLGLVTVLAGTGVATAVLALLAVGAAVVVAIVGRRAAADRAIEAYRIAADEPGITTYASVVAEALGQPASRVRMQLRDGITTVDLPGPAAEAFAAALDEVVSEPGQPRYVIARPVLPPLPPDRAGQVRLARSAAKGALDVPLVCHAVPAVFGARAEALVPFTAAWRERIADTEPLYTKNPAGAGLLASADPVSPAGVDTGIRVLWD